MVLSFMGIKIFNWLFVFFVWHWGVATFVVWGAPVRIKIQGSTTVNPVIEEAAERFREEKEWIILVDTLGGSSGGISALGEGLVDVAMSSRPIRQADRDRYPQVDFKVHPIGIDGVSLVVSNRVWEGGVHSLSRKEIQAIYEGKIKNWSLVGGEDQRIVFYNKEPGRGTWEVFAKWLYGDSNRAPRVNHPEVGGNEEGRNKIAFHGSAMTQLSFAWAEKSDRIKAVGIELSNGEVVFPTAEFIRTGDFPIARELFLITDGEPIGPIRDFIDFLLAGQGQALVEKYGYISLSSK